MKKNLTKRTVEALPVPESGRSEYRDAEVRGLGIRINADGVRTWFFRRTVNGRSYRPTLGEFPAVTPEQARKRALALAAQAAEGKPLRDEAGELTLRELFENYAAKNSSLKSLKQYRDSFRLYIDGPLGGKLLSTITRADVHKMHADVGKNHPTAANRALAVVRLLFNYAMKAGLFSGANPAEKHDTFTEKQRERFLTREEAQRFVDACAEEVEFGDLFSLLLFTAQRRANVLAMRWEDIDFHQKHDAGRGVWMIPETKNGKPFRVALAPVALKILERRWENRTSNEWAFPGTGSSGHVVYPYKAFRRVCKRARLAGVTIHDLRRTVPSWLAQEGCSLQQIAQITNHGDLASVKIYARLQPTSSDAILGGALSQFE